MPEKLSLRRRKHAGHRRSWMSNLGRAGGTRTHDPRIMSARPRALPTGRQKAAYWTLAAPLWSSKVCHNGVPLIIYQFSLSGRRLASRAVSGRVRDSPDDAIPSSTVRRVPDGVTSSSTLSGTIRHWSTRDGADRDHAAGHGRIGSSRADLCHFVPPASDGDSLRVLGKAQDCVRSRRMAVNPSASASEPQAFFMSTSAPSGFSAPAAGLGAPRAGWCSARATMRCRKKALRTLAVEVWVASHLTVVGDPFELACDFVVLGLPPSDGRRAAKSAQMLIDAGEFLSELLGRV